MEGGWEECGGRGERLEGVWRERWEWCVEGRIGVVRDLLNALPIQSSREEGSRYSSLGFVRLSPPCSHA